MGEPVSLVYDVPSDQVLRYKVTPEKGALMTLDSLGRQLTLLSKAICWDTDRKWKAMLQCINTSPDGPIEFTIIVADAGQQHLSQNLRPEPTLTPPLHDVLRSDEDAAPKT